MQNFSFLKAFCMETATNCIPFFKKTTPIPYESVDNGEITHWNGMEEKQKLKNEMFNEPSKPPIELNSMIPGNNMEAPVNRVPKNSQTADKSKLIGNINEDQLKKLEVSINSNAPPFLI